MNREMKAACAGEMKSSYGREPWVGVLTVRRHIADMVKQTPNRRLEMVAEANRDGLVGLYFFCLQHVDMEKMQIRGVALNEENGRWEEDVYPFPHVLYNRGGGARASGFGELIRLLRKRGCFFLNHTESFNKWEVYQHLRQNSQVRHFLPETRLYRRSADLRQMLAAHGTVYLKSCVGRKGRQVMRVQQRPGGVFQFSYDQGTPKVGRARFSRLKKRVRRFFGKKGFIIQEAILLPEAYGQRIDMRAEMQRNGRGVLEITGVSVREGMSGSPITTHAQSYRFADYAHRLAMGGEEPPALERRIREFLLSMYEAVEAGYGRIGEMGIDFALDTRGKLWFIECNSQPTKVSLAKAYDGETVHRAYRNPLAYARYLWEKERQ
jgi:hypothetical protein